MLGPAADADRRSRSLVYLLYAVPMALYVLWPDRLRPRARAGAGARSRPGPEPGLSADRRHRDDPTHPPPTAGVGRGRRRRHRARRRGGYLVGQETAEANADGTGTVPFYGEHQAGIDTPAQDRLHFAAFDLVDDEPGGAARADAGVVARRRPK